MKIVFGYNKINRVKGAVVALGIFDGMHLAHRYILNEAVKKAREFAGKSVVVTFYPHPRNELSLYSLEHRLRLMAELGVDICIIIKFTRAFSRITADEFVRDVLSKKIGAKFIFVGKDFRFGKDASGDCALLQELSGVYGYSLRVFDIINRRFGRVSSTYIRKLITLGKLQAAQRLLLRPVSVLGTVIKGISLARKLGFPTANIDPHHEILPPSGVYVVKVIFRGKVFDGVCNIGSKPTVLGIKKNIGVIRDKHVEVYIFDFNKNIYGEDLEIQFIRKLRKEKKFASIKLLAEQIRRDISLAKRIISRRGK